MVIFISLSYAVPIAQEDKVEPEIEAKEIKYESLRDSELQASINGGQSGWALSLISQGKKPDVVVNGLARPKREQDELLPMADRLVAPPSLPYDADYDKRLEGSEIYKQFAQKVAGRQQAALNFGRKKRSEDKEEPKEEPKEYDPADWTPSLDLSQEEMREIAQIQVYGRKKRQETEVETENYTPAPVVNEEYAKRLEGSAIYKALALAGGSRQSIERVPGYGRRKRQTETEENEVEVLEHFKSIDRASLPLTTGPKIKSWGEVGLSNPLVQN